MRDISTELAADIEAACTSLARLWKITRTDGTILYFTDSDKTVTFDGHDYRADLSFTTSSIVITSDYANAQSVTLMVAMDATGISEDDLRMKRYEGALGELSIINYLAPDHGIMKVYSGTFGRVEIGDKNAANIELVPLSASLVAHAIGSEVYSSTCRNSFGDAVCAFTGSPINLDSLKVPFTVSAVSTNVVSASAFSAADNFFAAGYIVWLTGNNAGVKSPIARSSSGNTVTLAQSPPQAVQVGDTGNAFPGCDKTLDTCIDKWHNILNFRGEPDVPDTIYLPETTIGAAPEG